MAFTAEQKSKVDAWLGKDAPRITLYRGGGYNLNLEKCSLNDISPLRGMPLSVLNIGGNPHLKDLSPLADCMLETLFADRDAELITQGFGHFTLHRGVPSADEH